MALPWLKKLAERAMVEHRVTSCATTEAISRMFLLCGRKWLGSHHSLLRGWYAGMTVLLSLSYHASEDYRSLYVRSRKVNAMLLRCFIALLSFQLWSRSFAAQEGYSYYLRFYSLMSPLEAGQWTEENVRYVVRCVPVKTWCCTRVLENSPTMPY